MALKGGEGSASRPGRSLPPGKTQCPSYRRLGGPQGRSGQVRKISPPPGFDPRTVQSVANRYTDCATQTTSKGITSVIFNVGTTWRVVISFTTLVTSSPGQYPCNLLNGRLVGPQSCLVHSGENLLFPPRNQMINPWSFSL